MPETETISTEYGEVEAETVTCENQNCDNKVVVDQTIDIVAGTAIRSWDSGRSNGEEYPAHRGVMGLEDEENPERQTWCLDCAEFELGYSKPAGRRHRWFRSNNMLPEIFGNPTFGASMTALSIAMIIILLL